MARESKELKLKESKKTNKKNSSTKDSKKSIDSGRSSKNFNLRNKMKIFCNSLETEFNYFKGFSIDVEKSKISNIKVEVLKTQKKGGLDPFNAVKYVIDNKDDCNEAWIVFDKDHFDIEKAIILAEKHNINVAWSNESFELWILNHFNRITTAMTRKDCLDKVDEIFKKKFKISYAKNNTTLYEILKSDINKAINFSKAQYQLNTHPANKANPCTTVFKLAESLQEKCK
ncbi:MAG: RloB family protein [Cetobacterium sp.]